MPLSADDPEDGEKFTGEMPWAVPCTWGRLKMIGFDACDADCDRGLEGFVEALKEGKYS